MAVEIPTEEHQFAFVTTSRNDAPSVNTDLENNDRPSTPVDIFEQPIRLHNPTDIVSRGGQQSSDAEQTYFPDGGFNSWLIVLGSFFLLMASYGLMNSVGVLQSYLQTHQLSDYSSRDVGWISSVFVFVALLLGVQIGPLFDRYGPKGLAYAGSVIFVASLFLLAECTRYWHFFLCFGILGGIGAALVSTVGMACVPHWFHVRAGMAMGTAMAGSGLGGVVFPFLLKAGFGNLGYPWAIRILAFVIAGLCALGSFLVKARLPKGKSKATINLKCFRDMRFTWMVFGTFCMELEVFALIGLYPTYVVTQGFGVNTSVYLLVVLNILSCLGRFVIGHIADRYGRLNVLMIQVALATLCLFTILYPFSHRLTALYVFSAIYGFSAGSFISLAPVCIRQISDTKEIGMKFGTCYSLVSFATLICIPIGGEMLEKIGARSVVLFFGSILVMTLMLLVMARLSCMEYKWHWRMRI